MKKLNIALLGFGNAGQAFARMLIDKLPEIESTYKTKVNVTAISTKTRGSIIDSSGINLNRILKDLEENKIFSPETPGYCHKNDFEIIREADYDLICELTPLNIETGQPAIDHIKEAFARNKHVITANKGPIAWAFNELSDLAREKNLLFFYETTVMDGTPIFNLVEKTLKLAKVSKVSGILNSTTNFILEEMAKNRPYDEILKEGKERGFIEADPSMDIEGYDAAAKITVLLNVLMDANMTPDQVDRRGIENIDLDDIKHAKENGKVIKLLCEGYKEGENVVATVKPVEVDRTHMLASIDSTTSVVSITSDLMGKVSIVEHEPEIEQTAYGIFGDLLRVIEEI